MPQVREPLLQKLEEERRRSGLSQEKFAVQVLGISYTTYQRWLHGKFNPTYQTLKRLEALLKEAREEEGLLTLTAVADPVLAELWDNPKDAAYDEL